MDRGRAPAREGSKGRGGPMDGKSGAREPQSDSARIRLLFRARRTLWIQFLVSDDPQTRNGPPKSDGDYDRGIALSIGRHCYALERVALGPHRGAPLAHRLDLVFLWRVYGSRCRFPSQSLARSQLADPVSRMHDSVHAALLATAHTHAE